MNRVTLRKHKLRQIDRTNETYTIFLYVIRNIAAIMALLKSTKATIAN